MNIVRENIGELELSLKIEISESDYQEKVAKQLKEYQKKAVVPGFRKGMAPIGVIQKMYKKAIMSDEIQNILSESLFKYVEDEKLEIVGSPLSNDEKTGEIDFDKKDFVFYFDAALMPQPVIKWDALNVKMNQIKIAAKEVDEEVNSMAQRYGKFETPETADVADHVYGKIVELEKDGSEKEGGLSTFISMDLNKVKSDDIKQLFVGKKAQDKVVFNPSKALDTDTLEKTLRLEKDVVKKFKSDVELTLSGISRITPHELNEELFNMAFPGGEVKDIDSFKKMVKKELEKAYNQQCQMIFVSEVRKALVESFDAYIPTEFLQRWLASRSEKETNLETIKQEWEEKYLPAIKWEFLEAQIRKIKDIDPTQNEVVDNIKTLMTANAPRPENISEEEYQEKLESAARSIAKDSKNVSQVYEKLYAEKLYAVLNEQIKPEIEKISVKEFVELNK